MPDDCVFCQIIDDKIDSHTVHETDKALAFLDLNPVSRGHTLVIPKTHAEDLTEMDEAYTDAVFNVAREIAAAMEGSLDPDGINLLQANGEAAGQEIKHAHVHVIPRYGDDGIDIDIQPGDLEDAEGTIEAIQERL